MAQHLANINTRHRLTQVIVLVVVILVTSLFAQIAKAQGTIRYGKAKYRIAVHKDANRTCYILHKKRTSRAKQAMFASARRPSRSKSSGLAETEDPGIASSN